MVFGKLFVLALTVVKHVFSFLFFFLSITFFFRPSPIGRVMVHNKDPGNTQRKNGSLQISKTPEVLSTTSGKRNTLAQRHQPGVVHAFLSKTFQTAERDWVQGSHVAAIGEIVDTPWRAQIDAVRYASKSIGHGIEHVGRRAASSAVNVGEKAFKTVAPFALGGSVVVTIALIGSLILVLKITKTGSGLIDKVV